MSIEISGSSALRAGMARETGELRVVSDATAAVRQTGDAAAGKDSLILSGAAALMHRLDSRISALPVVDTVRVNTIRQSIDNGSFHPDFLRVADRLFDQEIAVHGRRHGGAGG
jgi:flagellar biosynthesis anti-sigma factor FlgM